jgi:succinate dehydrogenase/fumarate reductase-like Fe-S protein
MYATQYGNAAHARMTYDEIEAGCKLDACVSCRECTAQCVNTVDIARRIDELKLIYA